MKTENYNQKEEKMIRIEKNQKIKNLLNSGKKRWDNQKKMKNWN